MVRRKHESHVSKTTPNVGVGVWMNSHYHLSNCGWERGVTRSSPVNSSRICSKLLTPKLITGNTITHRGKRCGVSGFGTKPTSSCYASTAVQGATSHDVIEGIAKTIVMTMAGHNIESVLPPQTTTMSNYHQRQKRRNEIRQAVQTYILIYTKTPCSMLF
ncbi:hypothetical protein Tco_0798311 [Tanacetum coccineum]